MEQLKPLPEKPSALTEIRIKVPEGRYFTDDQISRIEEQLLPLLAGQDCLQFGKLDALRCFWHNDGQLGGLGAIHLFAHLLLGRVARSPQMIQDPDCKVIRERIYRPNPSQPKIVSIVFTASLKLKIMRHKTSNAWRDFERLLELGSLEPLEETSELEELVAAG